MANKDKRKYKVMIGVSYEKDITVEAENSYEALAIVNKALVNSNLIEFSGKDIYTYMATSKPETVTNDDTDYCDVDAEDFVDGVAKVQMRTGGGAYIGECRLDDDFTNELDWYFDSDNEDYYAFEDEDLSEIEDE